MSFRSRRLVHLLLVTSTRVRIVNGCRREVDPRASLYFGSTIWLRNFVKSIDFGIACSLNLGIPRKFFFVRKRACNLIGGCSGSEVANTLWSGVHRNSGKYHGFTRRTFPSKK